jgi:dienelactone hydrolase
MSCPDCTSGNSLPGSPKGTEENGVYLAKGSSQPDTKDKAVIIFTDIFGLSISNPKLIADTIAERTGFDVWVPDLFDGTSFAVYDRLLSGRPALVVEQVAPQLNPRYSTSSSPAIREKRWGFGGRSGSTGPS